MPGTRLSLSTPMRLSFAGSRADLLLPIEEPVVSNVAATAIRACLDGVEKARTLLEGSGPLEVVELGALTASIGATHQALHRDTWGGIPNRIVLFVALDEVEDGDAGATVFADRSDNIKRSAPWFWLATSLPTTRPYYISGRRRRAVLKIGRCCTARSRRRRTPPRRRT